MVRWPYLDGHLTISLNVINVTLWKDDKYHKKEYHIPLTKNYLRYWKPTLVQVFCLTTQGWPWNMIVKIGDMFSKPRPVSNNLCLFEDKYQFNLHVSTRRIIFFVLTKSGQWVYGYESLYEVDMIGRGIFERQNSLKNPSGAHYEDWKKIFKL